MLSPWPGWDAAHPLVVHFPVALLMIAPLFVLLAIIVPKHGTCLGASAFVLLVAGTIAAFVAVETGESAEEFALKTDAITRVLSQHKALAELTRNVFTALTVLYGALLILPRASQRAARPAFRAVANLVMLILLAAGTLLVAGTGHLGGRLVHELGVRAMWPQTAAEAPANPAPGS